jgi:pimeloyl-ACP methyl ester carboxylesterase
MTFRRPVPNGFFYAVIIAAPLLSSTSLPAQTQPESTSLAGEWVGTVEVGRELQPVSVTFTAGDSPTGTITSLLSGSTPVALSSVSLERQRIRVELAGQGVLDGRLKGDSVTGSAETKEGRKGIFGLIRTMGLDRATLARNIGVYRFGDGRILLIDLLPGATQLYAVDVKSGQARAAFPVSPTEFVCGPALLVPYPTEQTLTFQMSGGQVAGVVRKPASGAIERAVRLNVREEQVQFHNGDVTLAGTLLLPPAGTRHPALVFAHGSGATPREWFWGFGYLMASRGFAVLAFDKRGTGGSSGKLRGASFEDLADDVAAGARFLQSRREVDGRRIGFWGLSQGAWIAPMAAVRFPAAAFVVTLSGGGLTPAQQELFNSEYAMRKAGFSDEDVREALAFQTARNDFMRTGTGWDDYVERRARAKAKPWYGLAGTDLSGPETTAGEMWGRMKGFYFYDPMPTLRVLRAPLLAIFGELDSPEGVKANVVGITAAMQTGGHKDFTIRVFPNGRHNLMDIGGFAPSDYARLQRFVPGFFDTTADWLRK